MMVKFKMNTKEFKTDIPMIPLVGEKITINESGVYTVKSIEHEIKGGFYNTCIVLFSPKITKKKKVTRKTTIKK